MNKKDKKKKPKRKLLDNLKQSKTPKVRKDLLDADYLDKLSPKELAWYAQFIGEFVGASIPKKKALHKNKKDIKEIYDSNNRRNRDILGVSKANGLLFDIYDQDEGWFLTNKNLTEDALIERIDQKKKPKT